MTKLNQQSESLIAELAESTDKRLKDVFAAQSYPKWEQHFASASGCCIAAPLASPNSPPSTTNPPKEQK